MTETSTESDPMADFRQAGGAIQRWTTELEAAREQVAALTREPVTDPAQAKKTAAALAVAREYAHRCVIGVDNAIDARNAAARAVVEAEAAALQPEVDEAAEALAEHDRITEELLAPLRAHTNREWEPIDPVKSWRAAGGDGRVTVPASVRGRLASVLKAAERRQQALRAAAAGGDPVNIIGDETLLPDSLRPGGVLPSATLTARQAQEAAQAQAEQEHAQLLAEAQRQVDAALEALGVDLDVRATDPPSEWTGQRGARWREQFGAGRDEAVWSDIDGHLARMPHLQLIASLCGWDAGNEAARLALPTMAAAPVNSAGEDQ